MINYEYISALKGTLYSGFSPQDTYFENIQDTPLLYPRALLVVLAIAIAEGILVHLQGKGKQWRLDITMVNILCGSLFLAWNNFILRGVDLVVYIWCYNNIRIAHLPWNDFYTYVIAVLGVDFCTYWWHRMAHEVAIFWASHVTHHNGEEFNISSSLRLSSFVRFTKWLHYVPLGVLGIPPSIFVIHSQLNFLFATWSHSLMFPKATKIIPGLGHLIEFIFVTPSHHRVHHGANKYCIDKNYGFVFIIWDRMFGTFAEERDDEEITYGTVSQIDTFHVIGIQVRPYQELFQKVQTMKTAGDKLRTLFYGPGWSPGKPRLGDEDDIPDVTGREYVKLSIPIWLKLYLMLQVLLIAFFVKETALRVKTLGPWLSLVNFSIVLSASTSTGGLYDSSSYAVWLEPLRLIFLVVTCNVYPLLSSHFITTLVSAFCLGSILIWPLLRHHFNTLNSYPTPAQNTVEEKKLH